jgi:hypothetical protein
MYLGGRIIVAIYLYTQTEAVKNNNKGEPGVYIMNTKYLI